MEEKALLFRGQSITSDGGPIWQVSAVSLGASLWSIVSIDKTVRGDPMVKHGFRGRNDYGPHLTLS